MIWAYIACFPIVWACCMYIAELLRWKPEHLKITLGGSLLFCILLPLLWLLVPLLWVAALIAVPIIGWAKLLDQNFWTKILTRLTSNANIPNPAVFQQRPVSVNDFPRKKKLV